MTDNQPKLPSGKEIEVLKLLITRSEMYGLEMVKSSKDALKRGTVYVLLSRMEDKGYICSRKSEDTNVAGMPKRLYKITGQGQRAYQAWEHVKSVYDASLVSTLGRVQHG